MRTMHSILKHGGLYWDQAVLPAEAYRRRFARVQAAIAASGDDGWLFFGDIARYGCVTYVTNFLPRVRSALVYVPVKGDVVLFANIGKRDVPAAKTITWVEDVRPFGKLPGEVISFFEGANLTHARIGLAGFEASIPVTDWNAIAKGLPDVQWQTRDEEVTALRAAKEDWEIAAMTRAAGILDKALSFAPGLIRPGETVRGIIAIIDRVARSAGAEDVRYMVASGPQAGIALHPVDDRVLAAGDTLLIYAAIEAQRYWAETARTFVLGPASPALKALHDRAMDRVAALRAAARPGVAASALAGVSTARALGYGLGNGIGLDAEEFPLIAPNAAGKLVAGATLALRAMLHEQNLGVAVAQTEAVGDRGVTAINEAAPLVEIGC